MSIAVLKGVIHGKTIELEQEPELPDGQRVSVQVELDEPPKWLQRFTVDPSIALGKLLVNFATMGAVPRSRTAKFTAESKKR